MAVAYENHAIVIKEKRKSVVFPSERIHAWFFSAGRTGRLDPLNLSIKVLPSRSELTLALHEHIRRRLV
jgi:hypothetical protein